MNWKYRAIKWFVIVTVMIGALIALDPTRCPQSGWEWWTFGGVTYECFIEYSPDVLNLQGPVVLFLGFAILFSVVGSLVRKSRGNRVS